LAAYTLALRALLNLEVKGTRWEEYDPLHRNKLLAGSFIEVCLLQCRRRPLIIAIDDMQWCDEKSLELLVQLSQSVLHAPLALLLTARSSADWSVPQRFPAAEEIKLEELTPEEAGKLLTALMGSHQTLNPIRRSLTDLSGGLPFFIEESVHHLIDKGALVGEPGNYRLSETYRSIVTPASVQAMVAARISSLPVPERNTPLAVSVVGKRFPIAFVAKIAGISEITAREHVGVLWARQLLLLTDDDSGVFCEFRHEFVREAAYTMTLKTTRRELHVKTVRAGELIFADRLPDWFGFLCHHAWLGELHVEGVRYERLAAQQAVYSSSYHLALGHCERALDHLEHLPPTRENAEAAIDIRLLLRVAAGGTSDFGVLLKHLDEAIRRAEELGDMPRRLLAIIHKTSALNFSGSATHAVQSGAAALDLAKVLSIHRSEVLARFSFSQALYTYGNYRGTIETLAPAIDWLADGHETEQIGTTGTTLALCLMMRCNASACVGQFDAARSDLAQLDALAQRTERSYDKVMVGYCDGFASLQKGDFVDALPVLENGYALCRETGINIFLPVIASLLGSALTANGNPSKAIPILVGAIGTAQQLGHCIAHTATTVALAAARLAGGDAYEGLRLAGEAKSAAKERGHRGMEVNATRVLAQCFMALDTSEVERPAFLLREAIDLAQDIEAVPAIATLLRSLLEVFARDAGRFQVQAECRRAIDVAQNFRRDTDADTVRSLLRVIARDQFS
jgi:hypothetical protein